MSYLQRLPIWLPLRLLFLSLITGSLLVVARPAAARSQGVVISEILVGDSSSASSEFVELYNMSGEDIDIRGWRLVYSSGSDTSNKEIATFQGGISARQSILLVSEDYNVPGGVAADFLFAYSGGLAAAGGHLKLIDNLGNEVDRIGWGNATNPESQAAPAPNNKSLMRINLETNTVEDSDNNALDFSVVEPNPNGGGFFEIEPELVPVEYQTIWITELFPDPAPPLTDTDDEFIELYNPNQVAVNIGGYMLETGSSFQYTFAIPQLVVEPGKYVVLYSADTNLTLANSASRARLLDPGGEPVFIAESYQSVGEGESWALFEDNWKTTTKPTPGAHNEYVISTSVQSERGDSDALAPCPAGKFRNPATNRCKNIESDGSLQACASNQFRNPETNRCKLIATSSSSLQPCTSGQYRNPETNRCKNLASSTATLKPCAPDQFRNPKTNRCKKIEQDDGLKPCDEGEERNPETNRCRKVAGASATNPLNNPAAIPQSKVHYPVIVLISIVALGYGAYEYRQEIALWFKKLFTTSTGR